jgi:hypothetical protein
VTKKSGQEKKKSEINKTEGKKRGKVKTTKGQYSGHYDINNSKSFAIKFNDLSLGHELLYFLIP